MEKRVIRRERETKEKKTGLIERERCGGARAAREEEREQKGTYVAEVGVRNRP